MGKMFENFIYRYETHTYHTFLESLTIGHDNGNCIFPKYDFWSHPIHPPPLALTPPAPSLLFKGGMGSILGTKIMLVLFKICVLCRFKNYFYSNRLFEGNQSYWPFKILVFSKTNSKNIQKSCFYIFVLVI